MWKCCVFLICIFQNNTSKENQRKLSMAMLKIREEMGEWEAAFECANENTSSIPTGSSTGAMTPTMVNKKSGLFVLKGLMNRTLHKMNDMLSPPRLNENQLNPASTLKCLPLWDNKTHSASCTALNSAQWERLRWEKTALEEAFERELQELQQQQEEELAAVEDVLRKCHSAEAEHLKEEHRSEMEELRTQQQEQVEEPNLGVVTIYGFEKCLLNVFVR